MTVKTISIFIFATGFWFNANAATSVERTDLGFYKNSIAELIDYGFELIGYQFEETSFISNIDLGGKSFSSISMGQALIINEQMTQLASEKVYAGFINSKISIEGVPLGEIKLYWRPSQGPFGMILSAFKYRLGRAFVLPQAPSQISTKTSSEMSTEKPTQKIIKDFFMIKWKNANRINNISDSKVELDFIKDFILKIQEAHTEIKELTIMGEISRYGDRKSNKTNYKVNLFGEQTGVIQCLNKVETNFNPYSTGDSYLKGSIVCKTSQLQGDNQGINQINDENAEKNR